MICNLHIGVVAIGVLASLYNAAGYDTASTSWKWTGVFRVQDVNNTYTWAFDRNHVGLDQSKVLVLEVQSEDGSIQKEGILDAGQNMYSSDPIEYDNLVEVGVVYLCTFRQDSWISIIDIKFPSPGHYAVYFDVAPNDFCHSSGDCFKSSYGAQLQPLLTLTSVEEEEDHHEEEHEGATNWGGTLKACFAVWGAVFAGVVLLGGGCHRFEKLEVGTVGVDFLNMFAAGALLGTAFCLVLNEAAHLMESSTACILLFYAMTYGCVCAEYDEEEVSGYWGAMILLGFISCGMIELCRHVIQSTFNDCFPSEDTVPDSHMCVDNGRKGEQRQPHVSPSPEGQAGDMTSLPACDVELAVVSAQDTPIEITATPAYESIPKEISENGGDEMKRSMYGVVSTVFVGDFFHNFSDGIFIGAAFQSCSAGVAWTIVISTIFHELAQEVADFIALTKKGRLSIMHALVVNAISGLSVVIGGIVVGAQEMDDATVGMLLAFGAGNYIYLAASELYPAFHAFDARWSKVVGLLLFVAGATAVGLVLLDDEHCQDDHDEHDY